MPCTSASIKCAGQPWGKPGHDVLKRALLQRVGFALIGHDGGYGSRIDA